MSRGVPNTMSYQDRKDALRARVSTLFSNDCHDPEGKFCSEGGSQSIYGPRGEPIADQRKFNGTAQIPSRSSWIGSISAAQKATLKREKLPIVKMGDKFLAPPPATDHAAYRAAQLGIGEMLQNDILKKVIETKKGDFHEDTRPGKDPRYDYTLADLPIKIGVILNQSGRVSTIIATHEALDREARRKVNASRGRTGRPDPQVSKDAANEKRAKALNLMNEWRVDHKLQPIELIEP
jgi:hypothetical protein